MLEFVHFDKQRLYAFKNNPTVTNSIHVDIQQGIHLLTFQEVDYFNYAFGSITEADQLSLIQRFFQNRKSGWHKAIVHCADIHSRNFMESRTDYRFKEIYCYFQAPTEKITPHRDEEIRLVKVDHTSIDLYATLYLDVFNADNKHPDSVEENLKLMLDIPSFNAYLVTSDHQEWMGICSFWINNQTLLYTAGGLRKEYRGRKFHLATLAARTIEAQQLGEFDRIASWALANSSSSHNLNAFGLTHTDNYHVYEFIGTP